MKLYQYLTLLFLIVTAWASIFILSLSQGARLEKVVSRHATTIKTIEANQHINALAIKTYIACLYKIDLQQTNTQISQAQQTCFDNAPEVK